MPEVKKVAPRKPGLVRRFFRSFVNVKQWISYEELSSNSRNTWGLLIRLLRRPKSTRRETYEEAVSRLGLTEKEEVKRKRSFLYSSFIYVFFAVGFFIYLIYLLISLRFLASSLTVLLMIVMALMAYKEHFWYMQMKQKKLGCNFQNWVDFVSRRSK